MRKSRQTLALLVVAVLLLTPNYAGATVSNEDMTSSWNETTFFDPNRTACVANQSVAVGSAPRTTDLKSFVDAYAQSAFNVGKQYKIPYEAILAQGALESGMGKSRLTTQAFNFFGIKAGSSWTGPVVTFNTQEQNANGSSYTVSAAFRAYPNAEAGFAGYGEFITSNPRYAKALQYPTDYAAYIREIKAAGYATDVNYVNKVTSLANAIAEYIKSTGAFPPSSTLTPSTTGPIVTQVDSNSVGCQATNISTVSGPAAQRIVSVAKQEFGRNPVPVEFDQNVLKYTDNRRENWCADFVSWVYKEAGVPFTGGASGGWRQAGVENLQKWFKANQTYFNVGSQLPRPGDVAFYIGSQTPDESSGRHVNIVISVDPTTNTMVTIGGNESDMVRQQTRKIQLGASNLVGFGRLKGIET